MISIPSVNFVPWQGSILEDLSIIGPQDNTKESLCYDIQGIIADVFSLLVFNIIDDTIESPDQRKDTKHSEIRLRRKAAAHKKSQHRTEKAKAPESPNSTLAGKTLKYKNATKAPAQTAINKARAG